MVRDTPFGVPFLAISGLGRGLQRLVVDGWFRNLATVNQTSPISRLQEEKHGGCQVYGPKVAKFLSIGLMVHEEEEEKIEP